MKVLLRKNHLKALESTLVRQRQVVRTRIGAGQDLEQAFQLERWNRELEQAFVDAGMARNRARPKARSINTDILARLRAGQSIENVYASLI